MLLCRFIHDKLRIIKISVQTVTNNEVDMEGF